MSRRSYTLDFEMKRICAQNVPNYNDDVELRGKRVLAPAMGGGERADKHSMDSVNFAWQGNSDSTIRKTFIVETTAWCNICKEIG